jgi:hypothetical protein
VRVDHGTSGGGVTQRCPATGDCLIGVVIEADDDSTIYRSVEGEMTKDLAAWTREGVERQRKALQDADPSGTELTVADIFDPAEFTAHTAALRMLDEDGDFLRNCSGTLTTSYTVLTAGECLRPGDGEAPTRFVAYVAATRKPGEDTVNAWLARCTGTVNPGYTRYDPSAPRQEDNYGMLWFDSCDNGTTHLDFAQVYEITGVAGEAIPDGSPISVWGYPSEVEQQDDGPTPYRMWTASVLADRPASDVLVDTDVRWTSAGALGGGVSQWCDEGEFGDCIVGVIVQPDRDGYVTYRAMDEQMKADVRFWTNADGSLTAGSPGTD